MQRISEDNADAQRDARQLDDVQVRGEIFGDDLIDVISITEIAGDAEGAQDDGNEEYGGVEESAEPMTISLNVE